MVIGIDSVLLTQKIPRFFGSTILRKGLIGVGIEVKDLEKFGKKYSVVLRDLFEKFDLRQRFPVYCSFDIAKLLESRPTGTERKFLTEFKDVLLPEIAQVHFFYTYLFGLKSNEISIFGATQYYKKIPLISKDEKTQDFYDLIAHSYPMLCAWELHSPEKKEEFLLDHFQGRLSPAWDELYSANFFVYHKGDKSNPLISVADIFTRLIKFEMLPNQKCFLLEEINKIGAIFPEKFVPHFIGKKRLNKIVPHDTAQIDTNRFLKHPIFFIAKETPQDDEEEVIIEQSPLFESIVKKCSESNGCFKYFNSSTDCQNIKSGDFFSYYGEKGEKTF